MMIRFRKEVFQWTWLKVVDPSKWKNIEFVFSFLYLLCSQMNTFFRRKTLNFCLYVVLSDTSVYTQEFKVFTYYVYLHNSQLKRPFSLKRCLEIIWAVSYSYSFTLYTKFSSWYHLHRQRMLNRRRYSIQVNKKITKMHLIGFSFLYHRFFIRSNDRKMNCVTEII